MFYRGLRVMSELKLHIDSAYWITPGCACILLSDNWNFEALPTFKLNDPALGILRLRRMPPSDLAYFTAYEHIDDATQFILDPNRHPHIDFHKDPVSVVGAFNNWGDCPNRSDFELISEAPHSTQALFTKTISSEQLNIDTESIEFKFVTRSGHWINPLSSAPNLKKDARGNLNYYLDPKRNGRHAFLFNLDGHRGLDRSISISLDQENFTPILPGLSFYDLKTDLPLGAVIESDQSTTFRLFAPRASKVSVEIQSTLDQPATRHSMNLMYDQLTWEVNIQNDLTGFFYNLFVEGHNDSISTLFDGNVPILDPYAKATVGPSGPAIIINQRATEPLENPFHPPHWHDLSILECHIKDLTAKIPPESNSESPTNGTFAAISKYLHSKDNYLLTLGVNAIELLPVQQFDSPNQESYHWGYMTNNYFSPCAWYTDTQDTFNPNQSFKQMVEDFHQYDKSVILDVVYNHVGEPPHLARIDKAYYFYLTDSGDFENWSGCGNTIRSESAMSKRLIIESLIHLIQTYDVDGFRFDLAELIGIEVLKEIEKALKAVKPSIILIAEPWSFRGEIKTDLRHAGFMFWNDEFREFAHEYVLGESHIDSLAYFIKGSTNYLAAWPSQSINYIASHDDRTWIDKITENPDYQGQDPTEKDIKRTHMAAALMFFSMGTPMLTQGLDFLKSKYGENDTYLRDDLNALDFSAIDIHLRTHNYFQNWIQFRQSEWGNCLRIENTPSSHYVRIFRSEHTEHSSAVILINADQSKGSKQILLMINPHQENSHIALGHALAEDWKAIASIDQFNFSGIETDLAFRNQDQINLPPISLLLCVRPAWNG